MDTANTGESKEDLILQAVRIQYSILQLLDHTLLDTYQYEKSLPKEEQNSEVMNLSYRARSIIAKKPKLKEIYKRLEEDYGLDYFD